MSKRAGNKIYYYYYQIMIIFVTDLVSKIS